MTAHEELEHARREMEQKIDIVFARCTPAEIAKCEQACVALLTAVAPHMPDLREYVRDLFTQRRALKAARMGAS